MGERTKVTPSVTRRASVDRHKLARARSFRAEPTEAEQCAWRLLRNRGVLGLKFRRQQIIRGFVVDFYCAALRIALELDGGVHTDRHQAEIDRQRDAALESIGVRVVRIQTDKVSDEALRKLLQPFASLALPA